MIKHLGALGVVGLLSACGAAPHSVGEHRVQAQPAGFGGGANILAFVTGSCPHAAEYLRKVLPDLLPEAAKRHFSLVIVDESSNSDDHDAVVELSPPGVKVAFDQAHSILSRYSLVVHAEYPTTLFLRPDGVAYSRVLGAANLVDYVRILDEVSRK